MHIAEQRFSIGLKTTSKMDLPVFTVINLSDAMKHKVLETLAGDWAAAGIQYWSAGTGYAAFAFRIRLMCDCWAEVWTRTLDQLDGLLSVDVIPTRRRALLC